MTDGTGKLAQSITWISSKQTYFTARLMVDKSLISDFYRAYAYFRWVDDIVDVSSQSHTERTSFIRRQRELIDCLYRNKRPDDLTPEEEIVADLISHDKKDNSGLQSFIRNMLANVEFDAYRKGQLVSQQELTWYSNCLGRAVTDGLQYFIGNSHSYPITDNRDSAAIATHLTHMLRDMVADTANGYSNIPREYLESNGINPDNVASPSFRAWVEARVDQARRYFHEGKRYLDELEVLRCKIAGYWYCARLEGILDIIERDGHILRPVYPKWYKLCALLKMVWLSVSVTLRHVTRQCYRDS